MNKELKEQIIKYLNKNYPNGVTIELGRDYELSIDTINQILSTKDKDTIYGIISEKEIEIIDDYEDDEIESIKNEIFNDIEGLDDIDEEELIDLIKEEVSINCPNLLDYATIEANIYPLNERNERLYFSNKENIEDINIGELEENSYGKNLLDSMKLLGVNPYEVGEILKEREDIILNNFPNYQFLEKMDAKKFFDEFDNSFYGGDLMFTTNIPLSDYVENIDTFKERGVLIPKGTQVGFIDSINGSCGFIGLETVSDIVIKNFDIRDDRTLEYGLDEICGVVKSYYWGASNLTFPKTKLEQNLIEKTKILSLNNQFEKPVLKRDDVLRLVGDFVTDLNKALTSKPFNEDMLNVKIFEEKYSKFYWIKDNPVMFKKALEIISDISSNIKEQSIDELADYIDTYKYNTDDFKSPIQKQLVGIKEFARNLNERLINNFETILSDERNKDNLPEIIKSNFDSLKTQFLNSEKTVQNDKRFSEKEKENFVFYCDSAINLIEFDKKEALINLENGSFDAKKTTKIIEDLKVLLDTNEYMIENFMDKIGKENQIKNKPRKDR